MSMAIDKTITRAFEALAQSLRVLLEADWHANRGGLLFVDRGEAVGNIETALAAVLNAFHSLYDAIEKQIGDPPIDWYASGPLATVLATRNARHHHLANGIRTLYSYHAQEVERPDRMAQYVFVDFPALEEGADTFDIYISWADLDTLLALPRSVSRLRPAACQTIRGYLDAQKFAQYAARYALPIHSVFLNIVPVFVNAAAEITPHLRGYVARDSTESQFFMEHFCSVTKSDTHAHEVNCGPFVLPK